jgi:hypothetical protein
MNTSVTAGLVSVQHETNVCVPHGTLSLLVVYSLVLRCSV